MSATSPQASWDDRIARARELAEIHPAARELLTFYAALAGYQQSLVRSSAGPQVRSSAGPQVRSSAGPVEIEDVLDAVPAFLVWLQQAAPEPLAQSASDAGSLDREEIRAAIAVERGDSDVAQAFRPALVLAVHAITQALAEHFAGETPASPATGTAAMHCPQCGGLPVAAVLREAGQGAKRSLLCAVCLTEWDSLRMVCPACGEQQFDALPIYTAEQFPHIRIDACDSCRRYLKTIDLTKDGLAVPCVDDIASVPFDLWAQEQGYTRVKTNLLGF